MPITPAMLDRGCGVGPQTLHLAERIRPAVGDLAEPGLLRPAMISAAVNGKTDVRKKGHHEKQPYGRGEKFFAPTTGATAPRRIEHRFDVFGLGRVMVSLDAYLPLSTPFRNCATKPLAMRPQAVPVALGAL